ncbi:MAG: hypothetical protein M1829_005027 [Trizodia sp. TS-e1964]|nr:MAG: hypothetical protein M1829_005027 [Trizodia sp. TS-e1964]
MDSHPSHSILASTSQWTAPSEAAASNASSNGSYTFPTGRLKQEMVDPSRTPLCLVACGSFSPITFLHLRMFEMAKDYINRNTDFEVVAGYLSPVSDAYQKPGLTSAEHRVNMCNLATAKASEWLMVDPWEAYQDEFTPTAEVLDHFDQLVNTAFIAYTTPHRGVRVALLAGADLIQTMSMPGVWHPDDLSHILGRYGAFVVERNGTDIGKALASLMKWRRNIWVVPQMIRNDVSSTKIRQCLRKDMSVKYLVPAPVIDYIEENGLYQDDGSDGILETLEERLARIDVRHGDHSKKWSDSGKTEPKLAKSYEEPVEERAHTPSWDVDNIGYW